MQDYDAHLCRIPKRVKYRRPAVGVRFYRNQLDTDQSDEFINTVEIHKKNKQLHINIEEVESAGKENPSTPLVYLINTTTGTGEEIK